MSWSSGKDSAFALHVARTALDVDVSALLVTINADADRVAMHAVRRRLLDVQAERLGIPLHIVEDRYQELIGECLADEREFGLIYADDDGLREIGTRAAVTEVLDRFDDGRLNVVVEGRERFRLLELTDGRTFQTGLVEPMSPLASSRLR